MMDVMSDVRPNGATVSMPFEDVVDRVPFLKALAATERERLRPYAEIRALGAGESIWAYDDPLQHYMFLIEGHVKLTRPTENGREVIIDVGGPGELLCSGAVSSFSPACCACVAFDDGVKVAVLPRRDVLHVVEQSPAAAAAFVRESTGREMRLGKRIVELASGQVEQRVAALMLRLADQVGTERDSGQIKIQLHLSRQDLADLCGTTLETAIRTMTKLAREDIVRTVASGFLITNRAGLEKLARGEPKRK
jgi:CRP-like cAMP-binding protein